MKKISIFILLVFNIFSIEKIKLTTTNDIIKFEKTKIKEVTYDINGISLENVVIIKKKENFINLMLPSIIKAKKDIEIVRSKAILLLKKDKISSKEKEWLEKIFEEYKVKGNNEKELMKRLVTVPVDLALAQAIYESGWGTSRFFREGNNVYGIWSFSENHSRMESNEGVRGGKKIYLKKYENVYECTKDYFYSLAVGNNYKKLREKLIDTNNSLELTKELGGYSELGDEYSNTLKSILKYNNLEKYNKISTF